ncbi:hypothetical protein ColKHC_04956 [Colletotrichum higginsianum]|nr:hypothetical protein ColKHC_04956 [Colletotrichum higginsianum]
MQQRRRLSALECGRVEGGQLALEDIEGPAVGYDVVHHDRQDVVPATGAQPEERDAPARLGGEVERLLLVQLKQLLEILAGRHVDELERPVLAGPDDLHAHAVVTLECGPKGLVTLLEDVKGGFEGFDAQGAAKSHGQRHEVSGAPNVELLEEPETALGEGLLDGARVLARLDGLVLGRVLLLEDLGGEVDDERLVEDVLDRHPRVEALAETGCKLGRHQRVAAQVEEAVGDADLGIQHAREFFHQGRLGVVARRHAGGGLLAAAPGRRLGYARELAAIGFAVGVQGHLIEDDDLDRDHVRRQQSLKALQDRLLRLGGGVRNHGGIENGRVAQHGLFDLGRLDAVTADLDLLVDAAKELDLTVSGAEPGPITRAVRPDRLVVAGDADVDEAVRIETGIRVPACETVSRDNQLSHDAHGHELLAGIDDVGPGVVDGPADGHAVGEALVAPDGIDGTGDRVLGRSVGVVDVDPGQALGLDGVAAVEAVAGGQDDIQSGNRTGGVGKALLQQGREHHRGLHAFAREDGLEGLAVDGGVVVDADDRAAVQEGHVDFPGGIVECRVGEALCVRTRGSIDSGIVAVHDVRGQDVGERDELDVREWALGGGRTIGTEEDQLAPRNGRENGFVPGGWDVDIEGQARLALRMPMKATMVWHDRGASTPINVSGANRRRRNQDATLSDCSSSSAYVSLEEESVTATAPERVATCSENKSTTLASRRFEQAQVAEGREPVGQAQPREDGVGLLEAAAEDLVEDVDDALDRLRSKKLLGEEHRAAETAVLGEQVEFEIEAGRGRHRHRFAHETVELDLAQILLRVKGEEELDEGVPRCVSGAGQQGGNDAFERHVLVLERGCRRRPDLSHEPVKGFRLGVHGDPHALRVDEEADQVFQFGAVAVGDRGPDRRVLGAGQPIMGSAEGGEKHDEGGRVVAAAKGLEGREQLALDVQLDDAGGTREHLRARLVTEHIGRLAAVQLVLPVGELAFVLVDLGLLLLPGRKVAVLHGQGGDLGQRIGSVDGHGVELAQLLAQDVDGPTVGNDVVHDDGEDVILAAQTQEGDAPAGLGGQVEGGCLLVAEGIDWDDVPRCSKLHLLEEPQTALGKGLLHGPGVGGGDNGAILRRPLLDRAGEVGQHGVVEDVFDGNPGVDAAAEAGGELGGHQRMPAEVEEAAGDADGLDAEDGGELVAKDALHLVAGRDDLRDVGGGRLAFEYKRLTLPGQLAAVDLAVGGEGQLGETREARGHHVRREELLEVLSERLFDLCGEQLLRRGAVLLDDDAVGVLRREEADELGVPGVVRPRDDNDGIADAGIGKHRLLDLGRLDPVTAHLDLLVHAAVELDLTIRPEAGPVSGPVRTDLPAGDGDMDKTAPVERRVRVSARETVARDDELAHDAQRHEALFGVGDVGARVADGAADGDAVGAVLPLLVVLLRGRRRRRHLEHGAVGGVLGRAVHVAERAAYEVGGLLRVLRPHPLAAGEHIVQITDDGGGLLKDLLQQRRGEEGGGDALAGQHAGELGGVEDRHAVDADQSAAVEKGRISHVAASKAKLDTWETVAVAEGFVSVGGCVLVSLTRRTIPRCSIMTPLGFPVDPEAAGARLRGRRCGFLGRAVGAGNLVERGADTHKLDVRQGGIGRDVRSDQDELSAGDEGEDHLDARGGHVDVEREVCEVGLEDAEEGDDRLAGPGRENAHQGLRPTAPQPAGEVVGAAIQLGVCQLGGGIRDGDGARLREGLGAEEVRDAGVARVVGHLHVQQAGVAELFLGVGERQRAQRGFRVREGLAEDLLEDVDDAGDGLPVEQVGGVEHRSAQAAGLLEEVELDVEAGRGGRRHRLAAREALELDPAEALLRVEGEHELHQRVAGRGGNDPLEGHVLVLKGRGRRRPDLLDDAAERVLVVDHDAHALRVDKEADHILKLGPVAVSYGRADCGIVGARETEVSHSEGGEQHGKRRRLVGLAEGLQGIIDLAVDAQENSSRAAGQDLGPGPVQKQLGRLSALEVVRPVLELAVVLLRLGLLLLPDGEVPVLDRERTQVGEGVLAAEGNGVEGDKLALEDLDGPPVGDDVVHDDREDVVVVGAQTQQGDAPAGLLGEVEGGGLFLLEDLGVDGVLEALVVVDDLYASALALLKGRSERLVALREGAEGDGHHVGGAEVELIDEPETGLGKGLLDRTAVLGGLDGRVFLGASADGGGQVGEDRVVEDGLDGDVGVQTAAEAGDQLGGQQGVPSEVEEAIVNADVDAEHAGVLLAQRCLDVVSGGHAGGSGGGSSRRGGRAGHGLGPARQETPVDFAVGVQGQLVEHDDLRGHHLLVDCSLRLGGELLLLLLLLSGLGLGVLRRRDDAVGEPDGDEADDLGILAVASPQNNSGVGGGRVPEDGLLHLGRLDAVAANLDLLIHAAEELDLTVRSVSDAVAGAVGPGRRLAVDGDLDEPADLQRRVRVSPGKAVAEDDELADNTDGNGLLAGVHDVGARVGRGPADGDAVDVGLVGDLVEGGEDGVLRRAVGVDKGPRDDGLDPGGVTGIAAVAGGQEELHGSQGRRGEGEALLEQGRREHGGLHAAGGEQGLQRLDVDGGEVVDADEGAPVQQGAIDLPGGGVKGNVGHMGHAGRRGQSREGIGVLGETHDAAVLDHDALWRAGRPGGVHDVREARRGRLRGGGRDGEGGLEGLAETHRLDVLSQRVGHGGIVAEKQQLASRTGREDGVETGHRGIDIQREVGHVGLEDAQERNDGVAGPRRQHADQRLVSHVPSSEKPRRQRIGLLVQLRVGQGGRGINNGRSIGLAQGQFAEHVSHAGVSRIRRPRDGEESLAVKLGQAIRQRERREDRLGVIQCAAEDLLEYGNDAADRGRREEVGGIHDASRKPPLFLEEVELHVEARGRRVGQTLARHVLELYASEPLLRMHGEHELHQRVARRVPRPGLQGRDDPLKGDVLVLERRVDRGPDLLDEGFKGLVGLVDGDAHALRVDEETDEILQLGPVAVGNGRAYGCVLHAGQPVVGGPEGGEEDDEGGGLASPAVGLEVLVGRALDDDGLDAGVARERRRTGPIAEQAGRLAPLELLAPVGKLSLVLGDLLLLPLPRGEVPVLDGQRRHVGEGVLAPGGRRVKGGQLALQDLEGPAVVDDVVHDDGEDVVLVTVTDAEEGRPPAGLGREIKGEALFLPEGLVEMAPAVLDMDDPERILGVVRVDDLDADAVLLLERGAERLVPELQRTKGRGQRLDVQGTAETDGKRHDVPRCPKVQLVQEPQAALGKGLLDRAGIRQSPDGVVPAGPLADGRGQVDDAGVVEDVLDRDLRVQPAGQAGGETGGHERVPPEVEEVVGDADVDAQDGGELVAQRGLDLVARLDPLRGGEEGLGPRRRPGLARELAAVDLAVGVEGQAVHDDDLDGHHVRREDGLEVVADLGLETAALVALEGAVGEEVRQTAEVLRGEVEEHAGLLLVVLVVVVVVIPDEVTAVEDGVDGPVLDPQFHAEAGLVGDVGEIGPGKGGVAPCKITDGGDPGGAVEEALRLVVFIEGLDEQPLDDGLAVGDVGDGDDGRGRRLGLGLEKVEKPG